MKQTYGMVQNKMDQWWNRRYQEDRKELTKLKGQDCGKKEGPGTFHLSSHIWKKIMLEEEKCTYIKIWIHRKNNSCSYWILTDRQYLDQKNKEIRLYTNRSITFVTYKYCSYSFSPVVMMQSEAWVAWTSVWAPDIHTVLLTEASRFCTFINIYKNKH
jgi:hypothetical protein